MTTTIEQLPITDQLPTRRLTPGWLRYFADFSDASYNAVTPKERRTLLRLRMGDNDDTEGLIQLGAAEAIREIMTEETGPNGMFVPNVPGCVYENYLHDETVAAWEDLCERQATDIDWQLVDRPEVPLELWSIACLGGMIIAARTVEGRGTYFYDVPPSPAAI